MKRLKKQWKQFTESFFKLDGRFLWVALADLLFVVFAVSISQLFNLYITGKANEITPFAQMESNFTSTGQIQAYTNTILNFIIMFVVFAIIYVFLLLASWTASQGFIWKTINRKQHSFKYYKKLFLMNLFLVPLYLIIFLLTAGIALLLQLLFKSIASRILYYAPLIVMTAFVYSIFVVVPVILYAINSLNLIYYEFSLTHLIRNSFGKMFDDIKRLRYIPVVLISTILVVFSSISSIFAGYSTIALTILLILFFAWMRFYLRDLVKEKI